MAKQTATVEFARRLRRRAAVVAAVAACAFAIAAGPAAAGPKEQPAVKDHYQVYIGDPARSFGAGDAPYGLEREWGSVRLTEPGTLPTAGGLRSPSITEGASAA